MASPIAALAFVALVMSFQFLLVGDELLEASFPDLSGEDAPSGINIIGDILAIGWGVFTLLFNALTFEVVDMPTWLKVPLSVAMIGPIVWAAVATLLRGAS